LYESEEVRLSTPQAAATAAFLPGDPRLCESPHGGARKAGSHGVRAKAASSSTYWLAFYETREIPIPRPLADSKIAHQRHA
jgi:hypothetical protein